MKVIKSLFTFSLIFFIGIVFTFNTRAETLGNVDIVASSSLQEETTVGPDAVINIVFSVTNNGTEQQTISLTPQWSGVLRYTTVPAGSTSDVTIDYTVTKTVDYGGSALNLNVLVEAGELSKMFSYSYLVERSPEATIEVTLPPNTKPVIGQAVTLITEINNIGNVPLHDMSVTHSVLDTVQLKLAELLPGANKIFNSRVLITPEMISNGMFQNTATLISNEVAVAPFVLETEYTGVVPTTESATKPVEAPVQVVTRVEPEPVKTVPEGALVNAEMPKTGYNQNTLLLIIGALLCGSMIIGCIALGRK